jgi:ArsR family transcriptional regulator
MTSKEISMLQTVQMFRAVADETRLRILNLLQQRELCVCQIVEVLGLGQSKVSRHLAHLRNAGLVNDRRDATWMYYSLAEPRGPLHEQILECVKRLSQEVPVAASDARTLVGLGTCGDLCSEDSSDGKGICGKSTAVAGV